MEEELREIKERVRKDLERAGLDQETIVLLEEAADILEVLEKSDSYQRQSFQLGVLVTKIGQRMKEKGG